MNSSHPDILVRLAGRLPAGVTLMVLAGATGAVAGVGAWFLKFAIGTLGAWFFGVASTAGVRWLPAVLVMAGIMLTVLYQRYVARMPLEHGTDMLRRDFERRHFRLSPWLCIHPLIASTITLGFGGSAGAEGPIAYAGAAMGSNVARIFRLPRPWQRILMGCGAGAGIAGIFKAPVAGILFTLEVLKVRLSTLSVLALTVAALAGALTCYVLTGFAFDVQFLPDSFFNPRTLGWVALLGVFCGLYSVYYSRIAAVLKRFFRSISSPWLRAAAGGIMVGACVALFPAFYGEGYVPITQLINGVTNQLWQRSLFWHGGDLTAADIFLMGLAVLLLKVFACIATNSSGGVAGDFTPTVFAGAFAGLVFATGANMAFDANLPVGLFCLFGASGVFAGVIHAPLMAVFLVAEIVGNGFGYVLPLAVVAAVSYIVVKLLSPGIKDAHNDDIDALANTPSLDKSQAQESDS